MANTNNEGAVSSTFPARRFHCEDCNLFFDSSKSLEVHLQYHKENLYVKWASQGQATAQNDVDNNNSTRVKDEPISAAADSSDTMTTKASPDFQRRSTPETAAPFTHPATPQSYHSAPSPYQNPEQPPFQHNAAFSQQFAHPPYAQTQHGEPLPSPWDQPQNYPGPDYTSHKVQRFHPYHPQERISQVSSSSPLYGQTLNQPTPSPSPNQCDKCGFVCDSAVQLSEHCNSLHPSTTQAHFQSPHAFSAKTYQSYHPDTVKVKEENEESADILDLDSQKVVYQGNEENVSGNFEHAPGPNNEARSAVMPWPEHKLYSPQSQLNGEGISIKSEHKMFQEQKVFSNEQKVFLPDQKPYPDMKHYVQDNKFFTNSHIQNSPKPFLHHDQKMYPSVPLPPMNEYQSAAPTGSHEIKPSYRPYDSPAAPQITSTQSPNPTSSAIPPISGKGANWKSNEARRPKTYNCTACNKWFTSSGHLKRHYNTTLHKNAVRSSGQPDPATMPISAHHHPTRDPNHSTRGPPPMTDNSRSPGAADDGRSADEAMQSSYASQGYERAHRPALQPTPKGPYTHLPHGNIDNSFLGNNPLANHPLPNQVGSHPLNLGNPPPGINPLDTGHHAMKSLPNSPVTNPPNGEAGPSVTPNHHLRGLLSISTTNNITIQAQPESTPPLMGHTLPPFSHLSGNLYSPKSSDRSEATAQEPTHTVLYLGQNFQQTLVQNYPNAMAPHVMDMATNNLLTASQVTFGEVNADSSGLIEIEMPIVESEGPLPSFAQLQTQRFGFVTPTYLQAHNVGGSGPDAQNFVIMESNLPVQEYRFAADLNIATQSRIPIFNQGFKDSKITSKILEIEDIIDYADKENYEAQVKSPNNTEIKIEYENNGSPLVTSSVSPLAEHNKMTARAATVHKCFECDKMFNKACYLTQHNKSFHSGAKPFKCTRCGKRFPDDTSYEEHVAKHAGVKPFKCEICPKSFNHKTDLRRHMCLHSGTKPFSCHHCGKGFIRKDHMLKHYDTHLKKSGRQS